MCELVSVRGGKFHRIADGQTLNFRSIKTACGCEIAPLNFYATASDADSYTGARLAAFMCKLCEKPVAPC